MKEFTTNIKHLIYTLVTLLTFAFGLTMLNQAQELNDAAKFISLTIIALSGWLSYELVTSENYKLVPLLCFGAAVVMMIYAMYYYGG